MIASNFAHLRIVAKLCLIVEHIEKRVSMIGRVEINGQSGRSDNLSVAKRLQCLIAAKSKRNYSINPHYAQRHSPYVDRMLHRLLPVFILILDCGENFVQVIAVSAPHIIPQNLRLSIRLNAVLNVARIKYKI